MTPQDTVLDNDAIRAAIMESLPSDPSVTVQDQQLVLPWSHRKALQLDCSLVIGARGAGKTAWTRALLTHQDNSPSGVLPPDLFPYPLTVVAGFSDQDQASHPSPPSSFTDLIQKEGDEYRLWLAVVLRSLASRVETTLPREGWASTLNWVRQQPEQAWTLLRQADQALLRENRGILFVFDALDRVSAKGDWAQVSAAIRALLRLVLELKGFRRLHGKVFLRTDQYTRGSFTDLPDIAKIRASRVELLWARLDLHELLWQSLTNGPPGQARHTFRSWCHDLSAGSFFEHSTPTPSEPISRHRWELPLPVQMWEDVQRALFEKLAGSRMGRGSRRGVPYTWIVNHLADAQGEATPRSFLTAIRQAAEESHHRYRDAEFPLHFEGLKRGVQAASDQRISEVEEDHPWLRNIMGPFANHAKVPMPAEDFDHVLSQTFGTIPDAVPGLTERLPMELRHQGVHGLITYMAQLGVLTRMNDGRLNMPDLYRIGFQLGRIGGIKPARSRTPQN